MSLGLIETEIKLIKMKYDKELDYLKFQIQLAELKFKQELIISIVVIVCPFYYHSNFFIKT